MKKEIKIGRADSNDIVTDDPSVSRLHAVIILNGTDWHIVDLNSTNGTFVNGARISGQATLMPHDILKVGNYIVPWKNYTQPKPATASTTQNMSRDAVITSTENAGTDNGNQTVVIIVVVVIVAAAVLTLVFTN